MHRVISTVSKCREGQAVKVFESPTTDSIFNIKEVDYFHQYGGDIVNLETGEKVDNDTYLDLLDKLAIHGDSDEY